MKMTRNAAGSADLNVVLRRAILGDLWTYFFIECQNWLGDWGKHEPMMQQVHSFLLFCCCEEKLQRANVKTRHPVYDKVCTAP